MIDQTENLKQALTEFSKAAIEEYGSDVEIRVDCGIARSSQIGKVKPFVVSIDPSIEIKTPNVRL